MLKKTLKILFCCLWLLFTFSFVEAGTILSAHKYAWSNNVGYINFGGVSVNDDSLSGYAWSTNKGFIKFDPSQGGVLNDGTGNLSGYAWGEQLGWIDFDDVGINSDGKFFGTATGSLVGTITFDCNYCDVETDWRQSSQISPARSPVIYSSTLFPPFSAVPEPETTSPESQAQIVETTPPGGGSVVTRTGPATPPRRSEPPTLIEAETIPPLFDVISEAVKTRLAPGELLPISVTLSNFGGGKRVDVLVEYSILTSDGKVIYKTNETVAVETTADFIKTIQIPFGTAPGIYNAKTSITYEGQVTPAITQFSFSVERKILGLYQSDFIRYGGVGILLLLLIAIAMLLLIKRRRTMRFVAFDYSNIPRDKRPFYEILSDTIMGMRQRVGDDALTIASHIDGLKIDTETGRVLELTSSPAKVIATLVTEYEQVLGKKVSFTLRR